MKVTLAFEKGSTTIMSRLIRWFTLSEYDHVEVIIEDKWISSSVFTDGVKIKDLHPLTDRWDYVEVDVDGRKKSKVMKFIKEQENLKYDWCGVFCTLFIKRRRESQDRWFCSEIVTRILQEFGVKGIDHIIPSEMTPRDLYILFKD